MIIQREDDPSLPLLISGTLIILPQSSAITALIGGKELALRSILTEKNRTVWLCLFKNSIAKP